ncbi:MAG: methyltransferase domain-containing protein [Opitutaceae bacterium]|nr:methyltransferase domain-containing protein [Opitutaceae bacterium]
MPYETRRGTVTPTPLPDERFSRETWLQVDFLAPDLRLPFSDRFFDFIVCSHTIEDLVDPTPLLREMRRIARAGYFETPSRLSEQAVGQRDRISYAPGHPHHYWIVETPDEARLLLAHKGDSLDGNPCSYVPLICYEKLLRTGVHADVCQLLWRDSFECEFVRGEGARRRATEFTARLGIRTSDRLVDGLVRAARRIKRLPQHLGAQSMHDWWQEMLRISRPYSRIPLR